MSKPLSYVDFWWVDGSQC